MDSDNSTDFKRCGKCNTEQPLENFCNNKNNADGLSWQCRACAKAWRDANQDKIRSYQEAYEPSPEIMERRRARAKERLKTDPAYRRRRVLAHRNRKREIRATHPNMLRLVEVKSQPCTDCGNSYPPDVMELDHVRGERGFSLNREQVIRPFCTQEVFETELAKCDVRCPTCHRLRHFYTRTRGRPLTEFEEAA